MMARTQISLDPELHRLARTRSADLGLSLAEYIRRLVQDDVGRPRRQADISAVFDLGASRGTDVAKEKDRYIGDAVSTGAVRRRARRHR
jgi:hypothetical protein